MEKAIVISLGGSLIAPDKIDARFLGEFRKILKSNYSNHKFVVVCGGGAIARKYMSALSHEKKPKKEIELAGIRATRMNAHFLMQFFGKEANDSLPKDMISVKNALPKNKVVICGALRFEDSATSDTTTAKLANYLHTSLINMTNVKGLYSKDPYKNHDAEFIHAISWKSFEEMALHHKYKPGQHFILDQKAAILLREHKIPAFIIGKDLSNLSNLLHNRDFIGTTIQG